MAKLLNSLRKRWYCANVGRQLARNEWSQPYWYEQAGSKIVACKLCPKLDVRNQRCRVPFGTPLRKCVVASIEVRLRTSKDKSVLEIGCLGSVLAKNVVEFSGGSWFGIDPMAPPGGVGDVQQGSAAAIPFDDASFDVVFASQSIEHWEEKTAGLPTPASHSDCLAEVHRVLKPGGKVSIDVPIHLHGHEMFVLGDTSRIGRLFAPELWANLQLERWRYDYEPLERYAPPAQDQVGWSQSVTSYSQADLERVREEGSAWLLVMTADKVAQSPLIA